MNAAPRTPVASRARLRRLRRSVRRLLRDIDLRPPLDVIDLCRRYGDHRGRPIILTPSRDLPVSVAFALWVETERADHILYQGFGSELHQRHHVMHELGHMLAGHGAKDLRRDAPGEDTGDDARLALMRSMTPSLPTALIARALRRHGYDTVQEQEAEFIASTILQWASDLEVLPIQTVDHPSVARLESVMRDRRGWL